jgi:predicted SnoaL-like aldol condensation-catalyzing enzyme
MTDTDRRDIVNEYFKLIATGKYKEGLRFFSPDCKTHNPYVEGGMDALTDAMMAASKDMAKTSEQPDFAVRHVLVDGNMAAAYTQLLNSKNNPGRGGLRQVHLFRFEGDKIVEYWDITQQIAPSMPNAAGSF